MVSREDKKKFEIAQKQWLIELSRKIKERQENGKAELKGYPGDLDNDGMLITGVWDKNRSNSV